MANKKFKIPIDSSDVKKATKAVDDLNEAIDETSSILNDVGVDTSIFDDLRNRVRGVVNGVVKFVKSLRTLKGAIAATGIGSLVVALGSLVSYFKNTEKGARTLAIATEAVGVIFGKLQTFAAELGEKIIETFSNPKQAINDLKDAIVNNITNRITGLIELFPKLGEAIELTFKGEFKEAAKVSADAIAMVALGVEDATDKAVDLGKKAKDGFNNIVTETKNAITEATKYVDATENLRKSINSITIANANLTKELETQQKIGEDTTRGYNERKIALENAEQAQLKLAQNVAKQAKLEEDLLRTDIAKTSNVEERRELENQLADKIAERIDAENSLSQVQLDLGKLVRELDIEEVERKQAIADIIRESNEDTTLSRLNAALEQSKIDQAAAIRELETLRATESEKNEVIKGFELQRQQLQKDADAEIEKQRLDARQKLFDDFKIEIEDERLLIQQKYEQQLNDLQIALENELITKKEYAELEQQIAQERSDAIETIEKNSAEQRKQTEIELQDAKISAQTQFLSATAGAIGELGNLFEEGTKASKAAALAEIAINTATGFIQGLNIAQKSASGTGPAAAFAFPIFYASQIAAVLGAANKAKQALSSTPTGGGGNGGNVTAPNQPPTPPTISLFGQSNESQNIIGNESTVGSNQSSNVRAYVVESDITSTQNTLNRYRQRSEIG